MSGDQKNLGSGLRGSTQRLLRHVYTVEVPRDRSTGRPLQTGAVPWRQLGGRIEVLLITSRRSRKWTIPKGWAVRWRGLPEQAGRETWEEAGVRGPVGPKVIGEIDAPKHYRFAGEIDWRLQVHSLEVTEIADEWPEQSQRERRWFTVAEAARLVRPKALGPLIELAAAQQGKARRRGE